MLYAGEDPENAAGVPDGLAAEAPRAAVVLPDALTRGGRGGAPEPRPPAAAPCSSRARPSPAPRPRCARFEARFREHFGRAPGPYAAVGYEAMRSVLAAIDARR